MIGDNCRDFAEFATGDAESKAAENACVAWAGDTTKAEKDLVVTHLVRGFGADFPSESRRGVRDGGCCFQGCDRGAGQRG